LIDLQNVTVRYGNNTVIENLNWSVRTGESWAVVGPNGSGKTTLLSLIAGDHPQAYGNHVVVFGLKRGTGESIWDIKRHIGMISPELHLHFDETLTCQDAVVSGFFDTNGLFEEPSDRQVRDARRILTEFGFREWAHCPLADLSLGEQRMVLLARALVKKPQLLILDEPCQGLDAEHTRKFLAGVTHLVRSKAATVLFVTHRPEEVPPGIHRQLVLG
jgi:molybdate transport system ATP-binding protein